MIRSLSLTLAGGALALTGCGGDARDAYCETVAEHQAELGEIAASPSPGALFEALDHYRDLAEEAPRDLTDEWRQVIGRIESLASALEQAGVDPSTYDPEVTLDQLAADDRRVVRNAARDLGDEQTREAMRGIEQQALDVCQTPLSQ